MYGMPHFVVLQMPLEFLAQQKQAHTFLTIRQIFEETLDREGGTLFVTECERNITVSRDIEFLLHNVVRRLFEDEFRHDTDAEPTLYHRHDRIVVPCCKMHIRYKSVTLEDFRYFGLRAYLFKKHEWLVAERGDRNLIIGGKPVSFR